MVDWENLNKVRRHNRNETMKHFITKSMVAKLLMDKDYYIYTERDFKNEFLAKMRVADVYAQKGKETIIVEIETKPTKKHNTELIKFYKDYTLYIIDLREISNDLEKMESQLRYKLGL